MEAGAAVGAIQGAGIAISSVKATTFIEGIIAVHEIGSTMAVTATVGAATGVCVAAAYLLATEGPPDPFTCTCK